MFIGVSRTKNKKTGEVYVQHKLFESYRTEKGPRKRPIMGLGILTVPRSEWKLLAHFLECELRGQPTMPGVYDKGLEQLANRLISTNNLSKAREEPKANPYEDEKPVLVYMSSMTTKARRSIGAELLCKKAWDMLGLSSILKKLKFSAISISLIMVLVFGRMISPGSEKHTIEWFRSRSALQELPGVVDLSKCGKDRFYNIADDLYEIKEKIEDMLFEKERELFPHTDATIFLYDLTNTYLEGHGLGNKLAKRGHCKSKRYDCPLITLALIVDDKGMPICSKIYRGNQSEPETMETMVEQMNKRLHGNQMPMTKPTVAMDCGIATDDNVKWLQENGYNYIVIRRGDESGEYRQQFENYRETFEVVSNKRSVYGDESTVYVLKAPNGLHNRSEETAKKEPELSRVLCYSEGKARKERAIYEKKDNPFLQDIDNFRRSISIGTIKDPTKIKDKLERIQVKHKKISTNYDASLTFEDDKVVGLSVARKQVEEKGLEPLFGCYVMETTHTCLSATEVWRLYMTLWHVESAFRSMKKSLGIRPIYHQHDDRTASHLFITVLAYHLLATIENQLSEKGDNRTWETIREVMTTVTRGTVTINSVSGKTYITRITDELEEIHKVIFDELGVKFSRNSILSVV